MIVKKFFCLSRKNIVVTAAAWLRSCALHAARKIRAEEWLHSLTLPNVKTKIGRGPDES